MRRIREGELARAIEILAYWRKFGGRVIGTRRKRHAFSLENVECCSVLELDLRG